MNFSLSQASRPQLLRAGLVIVIALVVLRLFYLQVIKHDYYVEQAHAIQVMPLTIVPERGELYASENGELVPLVMNERVYTVFVDPQTIVDKEKVVDTLRQVAGGELEDNIDMLLSDENKQVRYRIVARNISQTQAEMIDKADLSGVGLQQTNRRFYPEGNMGAQMFGYVNAEGVGQYGIEGALNEQLAGQEGILETVTDVHQIPLTIGEQNIDKPAKNGDDLVLTIDRTIQYKAEQLLRQGLKDSNATTGSMVVMDPDNGAVLAMASLPTYDPAKYFEVEDYSVLQNPIVSKPYENGSVIKVLTMAAGLDSGAINYHDTFNNTNIIYVDGEDFTNVEEDPADPSASMVDVLRYSLNTGVVHVLKQMGGGEVNGQARQTLYKYFHDRFRLGQETGIEQAGETTGSIPKPTGIVGPNVKYATMSFGQGMNVTMIQTAAALSAVINGGTYYQPHLVAGQIKADGSVEANQPKVISDNVVSDRVSAEAAEMIYQGRKQGFFGSVDPEGFKVGGKTGTSQILDPETGAYTDENSIGTYLGFGGAKQPEYVIMVKVDDANIPGYEGTAAAGPIFNKMSNWMIQHLQLEPNL